MGEGVSPTHGPGLNCQWWWGRDGAARRRSRGHGPATRRPSLDGRLPIDRAGQVCWADKPIGKMPTALERSGGVGVRFILDPARPAGSPLSSIAAVMTYQAGTVVKWHMGCCSLVSEKMKGDGSRVWRSRGGPRQAEKRSPEDPPIFSLRRTLVRSVGPPSSKQGGGMNGL